MIKTRSGRNFKMLGNPTSFECKLFFHDFDDIRILTNLERFLIFIKERKSSNLRDFLFADQILLGHHAVIQTNVMYGKGNKRVYDIISKRFYLL